jgi:sugar (pentulose or hexulose) kinase
MTLPASSSDATNRRDFLKSSSLAAVGAGWYPSVASATADLVTVTPAAAPGPDAAVYREAGERYRGLYPALAPTFHRTP